MKLYCAWALVGPLTLVASCAKPRPAAAPPDLGPGWRFEVASDATGRELSVAATFPRGTSSRFVVEPGGEAFVRDVEVRRGDRWIALAPRDEEWTIPCLHGCTIRYRYLLGAAAEKLNDLDLALAESGIYEAPPSMWLLRPRRAPGHTPATFHVSTPPGVSFASGVFPDPNGPRGSFRSTASDLEMAPYSAFGRMKVHELYQQGAVFEVAVPLGDEETAAPSFSVSEGELDRWLSTGVNAVASFYHRFPLPRVLLMILPCEGDEVSHGRTLAGGGATIVLRVGQEATSAALDDDWVLVHELTHLAFPSLPRRYGWLEEGLATYVEPIARARIGALSEEEVWRGLMLGLPKGLPQAGDRGLDRTPTWGRTYWGGALFCLLADLQIRDRTGNKKSLDDALRGILDAGGNDAVRWDFHRTLAIGDQAVGTTVLRDLHAQMGDRPQSVDLSRLFARLGVHHRGRHLWFDDKAPLASLRRAMTARDPSAPTVVVNNEVASCADERPNIAPCVTPRATSGPRWLE